MENRTVKGIQDVLHKMFVVDKRKRISVSLNRGEIQLFRVGELNRLARELLELLQNAVRTR